MSLPSKGHGVQVKRLRPRLVTCTQQHSTEKTRITRVRAGPFGILKLDLPSKLHARLHLGVNMRLMCQVRLGLLGHCCLVACRRLPGVESCCLNLLVELRLLFAKELQLSSVFVIPAGKLIHHLLRVAACLVGSFDGRIILALECLSPTALACHLNLIERFRVRHT